MKRVNIQPWDAVINFPGSGDKHLKRSLKGAEAKLGPPHIAFIEDRLVGDAVPNSCGTKRVLDWYGFAEPSAPPKVVPRSERFPWVATLSSQTDAADMAS